MVDTKKRNESLQIETQSPRKYRKRRSLLFASLVLSLVVLAVTNPHSKIRYLREVSREFHEDWCLQPEGELCEMVAPMSQPFLQVFLIPFTQANDYWFLTVFYTRLPCIDILGIGIAGQFIIFPMPDENASVCYLQGIN